MKQFLLALTLAVPMFAFAQSEYFEPPKEAVKTQQWCGSGSDFAGGGLGNA